MANHDLLDVTKLMEDVDRIVTTIQAEVNTFAFPGTADQPMIAADRVRAVESLDTLLMPSRDGLVEIRVIDDGMTVVADFFPPVGAGKPVLYDTVVFQLEKLGIVHGVLLPVIQQALNDSTLDLKTFEDLVIARGTPPTDALPERWEILPELVEKKRVLDEEALKLDYKTQSPFVLVKKGELLATRLPEQAGDRGWDVYSHPIEFVKRKDLSPEPGENVISTPEGYRAACDGVLRTTPRSFKVDKVLVLRSGVGYETGHVEFPGDIHILGEIAAGFVIHAEGSVFSNHVIDASEIVSGRDIVTPFGIVGRKGCLVKASGKIRAKFLETVVAQAKEGIYIQSSLLNSSIQTLDRLVMGDRGIVMGGRVQAQNGVDVYQVGSERGIKAELVCGVDFSVMDKVVWCRDQCLTLTKQMRALEEFKRVHPEQGPRLDPGIAKLRGQIRILSEQSRALAIKVDRNDDATVLVRGTIHQGSYVEICHVSYVVSRPLTRVRFKLDKRKGIILVEPA